MSVKYSWSRQNGAAVPPVRFMSIEPAEDYYKGMPLKLKEKGIVEPTDGDPEYICMAQYDPDAEIQPLEIPVQEVFPDVVYDRMNDDGTIEEVRFGSKGGGGDLLETVETEVPLVITFDGDLTGKEYIDSGNGTYTIKYSDAILSYDEIIGTTAVFFANSIEEVVLTEENVMDGSALGVPGFIASGLSTHDFGIFFVHENVSAEGFNFTPGIWSLVVFDEDSGFTSGLKSLTCPNATTTTTKQQLKPSLLPPHSHKWADIEDAICYDRSKSEPLNITFDGDMTNRESLEMTEGVYFVKVSDAVLTMDDLIGGTFTLILSGEESEIPLTNENVADMGAQGVSAIASTEEYWMAVYGDTSALGFSLSPGVWFVYNPEELLIKSLSNPNATITTGELKKIDNKFIDAEWMAKENILTELTFDGNPAGHETAYDGGAVKISDRIFTVEELTGCLVSLKTEYGNGSYEAVPEYIASQGRIDVEGEEGTPFVYVFLEDNSEGVSPGLYVFCGAAGNYVSSIKFANPIGDITPLPPKFMPELTQVILISPGGKKFKTTVDDTGQLVTTEV